jgi:hypothetical protein
MFKNQYEARFQPINGEYEFFQYSANTNEEAIKKAKNHALKYAKTLKNIYLFNDEKFTLNNIYTNN